MPMMIDMPRLLSGAATLAVAAAMLFPAVPAHSQVEARNAAPAKTVTRREVMGLSLLREAGVLS